VANTAVQNQLALIQKLQELAQAVDAVIQDPTLDRIKTLADLIGNLEHPPRAIEFASDEDQQMELLRTLEIHGDGLRPCLPDALGFQTGDLLITQKRALWLVVAVDENGKIMNLTGASKAAEPNAKNVKFMWRPDKHARAWLRKDQKAASGYLDLNKALADLVRLWGNETSDEGFDLTTSIGFFRAVVNTSGVSVDGGELSEFAEPGDVNAFCGERGGLIVARPPVSATPGDMVLMNGSKNWGLVTRTSETGAVEDVLTAGLPRIGDLQVSAKAVKLVRGVDPPQIGKIWRPASKSASPKTG
jgi:hypothetical protein